ncbi:aLK and LTK ligand 2a [Gasterosteus aculeatus]
MSGLRKHVTVGLVLLVCALTGHCGESAPSAAPSPAAAGAERVKQDFRRMMEIVRNVEHGRARPVANTEAAPTPRTGSPAVEPKDLRNSKSNRGDPVVAVFPRDLRKKEKFIKYITGPLYFSPKCRKHVYRLYHHTRDCTIPAYFKRCARLLTRLAGSRQCTEG